MKILLWPADQSGCGWYRLMFAGKALAEKGYDVSVDHKGPTVIWSHRWPGAEEGKPPTPDVRVVGVEPLDADVVVMQRPARRWWADITPHLQAQGIRVVVDVDDLFDQIPKANIGRTGYQHPHVNPSWVEEICKRADVVTATTSALAMRYGYGKAVVLPNLVPESYLSIYGLKVPNSIGWPGTVETHPGDLASTAGGVAAAMAGTDWRFRVTGTGWHVARELGLPPDKLDVGGLVSFEDWPYAVAELEVGIVPLRPSAFNRAKSALKASEMAALGVPVVMSSTPDNERLHRLGVGLMADSRGQWKRQVGSLIREPERRCELAEKGREVMATQTYEAQCERWLEAWTAKVRQPA